MQSQMKNGFCAFEEIRIHWMMFTLGNRAEYGRKWHNEDGSVMWANSEDLEIYTKFVVILLVDNQLIPDESGILLFLNC